MIVPMKKAAILIPEKERELTLVALRKLGVVHINTSNQKSDTLHILEENRERHEKALRIIPDDKKEKKKSTSGPRAQIAAQESGDTAGIADRVLAFYEKMIHAKEHLDQLKQKFKQIEPWGDFDPAIVREIQKRCVEFHFLTIRNDELKEIKNDIDYIMLKRIKTNVFLVLLGPVAELPPSAREFAIPEKSLSALDDEIASEERGLEKMGDEFASFSVMIPPVEKEIARLDKEIEFEKVLLSMQGEKNIVYVSGFIPLPCVGELKKKAAENSWGLIIDSPADGDDVPTLIKNPKWITIIQPVFDFLGTIPGYREKDISLFFLLFFCLFYGMIIGDAAYGCIFLLLSVSLLIFGGKSIKKLATLIVVTSITTIAWGAMNGTWFGISPDIILTTPPFSWFALPALVSRPGNDPTMLVMHLCFIIGAVHLTLAHLWGMLSKMPQLKFISDIGWISVIWGGYFIIRFLVLKYELFPYAPHMFLGGFIVVIATSEQEGKFFKGMLMGLAKFPLTFLSSISAMADVISYVRLFAVGLAGLKVEEAFNNMAAGFGFGFPGIIAAVLILIFGHSLNLVLGIMSVIVHGVRLNMLEFSGHLGLEWSGREYKPFKESAKLEG